MGAAGTPVTVSNAQMQDATATMPTHCHVVGAMNARTSTVDGLRYEIKFRLRMPIAWNGRFFMEGGGGSNGNLSAATGSLGGQQTLTALSLGFAVVSTDSGHDNAVNSDPNAGGGAAFGRDPQSRVEFAYRSYDLVAQYAKGAIEKFYAEKAARSYFVGCSEGGRQGAMLTQRFPTHFDGIVAGDPLVHIPYSASYGAYIVQSIAPLAIAQGNVDASGTPLLNKTFTDADVQLVASTVNNTCDALDGLADGMSLNTAACTDALVKPELNKLVCTGAKTSTCLAQGQLTALYRAMGGVKTSTGQQLHTPQPWDPGIGGMNGATFNNGFRSWWLGTFTSATNNLSKVSVATPLQSMVWRTPPVPMQSSQYMSYNLNFNVDDTQTLINATTALYTESSLSLGLADAGNLSAFKNNGGKLIIYHGNADGSLPATGSIKWLDNIQAVHGPDTASFARLFVVPGMNHCSGGPATDNFDMLTPLVNWVERGVAPDRVLATATTPGYFGVAARSRPLCPYPSYAKYNGSGDVNLAASFTCTAP
jgi:feruloyl esterase